MIYCKRHIIATGLISLLSLSCWAEAYVVDDSDNFAIVDGRQAQGAPVFDEPGMIDGYPTDDSAALAKDDQLSASNGLSDNAKLIDKIQSLQQEVQELRGLLEVQAHDLKLLQQQQVAFYKDLDARIGGAGTAKAMPQGAAASTDLSKNTSAVVPQDPGRVAVSATSLIPVSRANPADEQISYLAAYELVKNKRYDDALSAMSLFVQKYPKGGYSANAQYWLGELYLAKKDYAKAIHHFDMVLEQFPTSGKSAASMLKLGYSYAAMGNKQEARKFLQQVVRAYPDTPTAQLANSKLQTI